MHIVTTWGTIVVALAMAGCGAPEPERVSETNQPLQASPAQEGDANVQTAVGKQISAEEARALLEAANAAEASGEVDVDLEALLAEIKRTDGSERQGLMMEYLDAADKLPKNERDQAVERLKALFR